MAGASNSKRVAIIGMGGIGCYYAAVLARAGFPVWGLARGENLRAILRSGIEVRTAEGSWVQRVDAADDPRQIVAKFSEGDIAVVATKSYSLAEVAPAVRVFAQRGATVLPLLNGVDAADRLAEQGIDRRQILGGTTYISAARIAPGVVERRTPFQRLVVGELDGSSSARAEGVAEIFRAAGVEASATEDITAALWQKFVLLASIAAVCGVARSPVGGVRRTPAGVRSFHRAVNEVVALGRARGVALPADAAEHAIGQLEAFPDDARPSLLLDLEAGARTEVDVLSAAISRMAQEAGIATPVHDLAAAALLLAAPKAQKDPS